MLLRYAPGEITPARRQRWRRSRRRRQQSQRVEELYLTGVHLAQYRHATRRPEIYWQEALRRDPLDSRANTALAEWHMLRGEFSAAEALLRKAIERLTALNPNPAEGSAFYLLGLTLRFMERVSESYEAFSKATWNAAWKAPAHYALAQADAAAGRWELALQHARRSLLCDAENLNARNLAALALRALHRNEEADTMLAETRAMDPLDHWSRHLASGRRACGQLTLFSIWCGTTPIAVNRRQP